MAQFDLNALMQDPNFVSGIGLLGGASPRNKPLLEAYQMLRQMEQQKMQQAQQQMQQAESQNLQRYREAQIEVARENAARYGQQNELARQKLEQGKQTRELFLRLMQGQPNILPQPEQPQMVAPPEPVGKYGTPKRILQSLKQVESNGNPFALGPDIGGGVRAQGAFQFLPSTTKMLRNQGIQFDPFNPQQAEDAADFYLQSLVKQHGGDYEKALAEYGGFKTKDPTAYVSKVLSGSPEKQAQQHAQLQNAQAMRQKNQQAFGYVPDFTLDGDEIKINLKPNYEQQRLGISQAELGLNERRVAADEARVGLEARRVGAAVQQAETDVQKEARLKQESTRKLDADKTQDWRSFASTTTNLDTLSKKVEELGKMPGLERIFGIQGKAPDWPGSPAADARALHKSLVSQLAKETLQAVRDASKTGGAFGNVSDKDVELLETAIQNLGSAQSAESARKAMGEVQQYTARIRNIAMEAFERTHGENPIKGLPPGARYGGVDPKTGKNYYRLPNGKFVLEK